MEYFTKYARYLLIGGLLATLAIPFIKADGTMFPAMFFPFITGKNFTFRILTEVLFGTYVILALYDPKYRPRYSGVLAAVLGFTLWIGVATIFSVDPTKSFWSNFERMEGYITVLHLLAYFLMMATVLSVERLWTWFLRLSVAGSVLMSGYGLLQLAGKIAIDQGSTRLDGTLGNATYMAVYLLFNVFFAIVLLYREWGNKMLRYLYALAILLDAFIILYTQTRGTILGLIGGLIVAGLYLVLFGKQDLAALALRKWTLWGLGIIALVVIAFIPLRHTAFIEHTPALQRLASISLSDTTVKARFAYIWPMALEGFKEKPLFGWGQENFNFVFNKYYKPAMYENEQWFDRAHNAFLDWLIAGGLLGFLLFVSLFATAAWALWRAQIPVAERAIFLGLLAAYAFHELFVFDNLVSYLLFFAVLAFAHGLSQRPTLGSVRLFTPVSSNALSVISPIVIAATFAAAWFLNAGGIANATGLIKAISSPSTPAGLTNNLQAFQSVLQGAPLGRQEAVEQLMQFAPMVAQVSSVSPQVKQQFFDAGAAAIEEMTKERPGDARLELFWGAYLDQFGQHSQAIDHLVQALKDSPNKQQILFQIGLNNRLPQGDTSGALEALKQAYELDTTYDDARSYYAAILYVAGRDTEADQLLKNRYGTVTPPSNSLVKIFFQMKLYAKAQAILRAWVAKEPQNTNAWLQLASIYYAQGDTASAVAVIEQAANVNSEIASQKETLLSQLRSGQ